MCSFCFIYRVIHWIWHTYSTTECLLCLQRRRGENSTTLDCRVRLPKFLLSSVGPIDDVCPLAPTLGIIPWGLGIFSWCFLDFFYFFLFFSVCVCQFSFCLNAVNMDPCNTAILVSSSTMYESGISLGLVWYEECGNEEWWNRIVIPIP